MTLVTRTYDDEQWALVPKEPNNEMDRKGWIDTEDVTPSDIYVAMLAAAPQPPEAQAAPVGAKPVATVRVRHGGYGMELSEYVAYALPEGLHDLYTTPEAQAAPVAAMTDEIREFLENLAKAGSEPLNSVAAYRDAESRRHFMGEIRNTARALLARAAETVESAAHGIAARTDRKTKPIPPLGDNTGHGHVWLRPDGLRARCGGPGMCSQCDSDAARTGSKQP